MQLKLKVKGFAREQILAVYSRKEITKNALESGSLVGGVFGLLAGATMLILPRIGPLLAAGPIAAILSSIGAGAAVGASTALAKGLDVDTKKAEGVQQVLLAGKILLIVHAHAAEQATAALSILDATGAENISESFTPLAG